jgi:DNA polymerase-3 subunit beta
MRFAIKSKVLSAALAMVSRATNARSTLPVLANVLLEAGGDGQLSVKSTNLEIAIVCRIPCLVTEPGAFTLPARQLADWLALQAGQLVVEDGRLGASLTLKVGRNQATIKGIGADEFPTVDDTLPSDAARLETSALVRLASRTAYASADDDTRPALTSVLISTDGAKVHGVATDGYRLAQAFEAGDLALSDGLGVLVPADTLAQVARLAGKSTSVQVALLPGRILFGFTHDDVEITLISQLIDARFPNYQAIVPKSRELEASVDSAALLAGLKVVAPFGGKDRDARLLRLSVWPERIELRSQDSEIGDALATVDATVVATGDAPMNMDGRTTPLLEIGLSGKWLAEGVAASGAERVALEFTDAKRAMSLRPVDGGDYQYLLMPRAL